MTDPKAQVKSIKSDFESLISKQRQIVQQLLDGLAPGVSQQERDALRKTYAPLGTQRDKKAPDQPQPPAVD